MFPTFENRIRPKFSGGYGYYFCLVYLRFFFFPKDRIFHFSPETGNYKAQGPLGTIFINHTHNSMTGTQQLLNYATSNSYKISSIMLSAPWDKPNIFTMRAPLFTIHKEKREAPRAPVVLTGFVMKTNIVHPFCKKGSLNLHATQQMMFTSSTSCS